MHGRALFFAVALVAATPVGDAAATEWIRRPVSDAAAAVRAAVNLVVAVDLARLGSPNGTVIAGTVAGQWVGASVAAAGDVNRDGIDDYVIGATGAAHLGIPGAGAAYVIFGRTGTQPSRITLPPAAGRGFTINGAYENGRFGGSVSGGGDVNRDGYDDVVVSEISGVSQYEPNAYVIYGKATSSAVNVASMTTKQGLRLSIPSRQAGAQVTVAGGFDFNRDGYSDVAVGSAGSDAGPSDSGSGRVFVVYGRSTATGRNVDLGMLKYGTGAAGFEVGIYEPAFYLGAALARAGDVNGDGYGDLVIGSIGARPSVGPRGAFLLLGRSGMPPQNQAETLPVIVNDGSDDLLGAGVGGGHDVNGDGYDDIVVSAPGATVDGVQFAGRGWVIYGSRRPAARTVVATLPASRGVRLEPEIAPGAIGRPVAVAGDLDGDGRADVVIGSPAASVFPRPSSGGGYAVFGRRTGLASVDLQTLDGLSGFYIDGRSGARAGNAVAGAGDVDRDGFGDLLVGAERDSPSGVAEAGAVYLIRGRAVGPIARVGTAAAERITGSVDDDSLDGGGGDDVIDARDGDDVVIGGLGKDRITTGRGLDLIRYRSTAESPPGTPRDMVEDFDPLSDRIDLSIIDANLRSPGNQTFSFIGTAAFGAPGQIRARRIDQAGTANDYTLVEMNVDADTTPEMAIRVRGLVTFTSTHFIR